MTKTQANLLKIVTRGAEKARAAGDVAKALNFDRIANQVRKNAGEEMLGWGLPTETVIDSGKVDDKGRQIGYLVGFNTDGKQFATWVQNARNGVEFGTAQRSRTFTTENGAKSWANVTTRERIAKIK